MFEGAAEAAMTFYVSVFPDAALVAVDRYGPAEAGPEGSVKTARFTIAGREIMCIDSPAKHAFGFTPSMSLFVDCEAQDEIERLAAALGEGGSVMMPLGNYGFSRQFAWVQDRFGVSWQLNLP
ncbi:VOC family protein [Phreatobacter sp.]|uniref:VOC family protein n=1 Tax=Phreatobacter sp. TaxID=1966341 RepID=UPI003F703C28